MEGDRVTNLLIRAILLAGGLLLSGQLCAARLSVEASRPLIGLGDIAQVGLRISELGQGNAPSLGAFRIALDYDDTLLALRSVDYGASLGDPTDPAETDILTQTAPARVTLNETSFLLDTELDTLQPAGFILVSLAFEGIGLGESPLRYGAVDLSDAFGSSLTPVLEGSTVAVVPLPGAAVLFVCALGLLGLPCCRRSAAVATRPRA